MITYEEKVTSEEKILLADIQDLEYGEIYNVELLEKSGRPDIVIKLTKAQQALVKLIRDGVVSFRSIKVHQSDPAYVEVDGKTRYGHYDCKRLYKLN